MADSTTSAPPDEILRRLAATDAQLDRQLAATIAPLGLDPALLLALAPPPDAEPRLLAAARVEIEALLPSRAHRWVDASRPSRAALRLPSLRI